MKIPALGQRMARIRFPVPNRAKGSDRNKYQPRKDEGQPAQRREQAKAGGGK